MEKLAPIALFTYNRPSETKQTIEALGRNYLAQDSELIIFSDGHKTPEDKIKVDAVRKYLRSIDYFKKIRIKESLANRGLAHSIISGVTEVIQEYGKIIVLEDDHITSQNFLDFMNKALDIFRDENLIKSINGYSPDIVNYLGQKDDIFLAKRPFPWGWGTWSKEWQPEKFHDHHMLQQALLEKVQLKKQLGNDLPRMIRRYLDKKNNSWYVRWVLQHYFNNKFSLFPKLSKVENVGFNNNGTHCGYINTYKHAFDYENKRSFHYTNDVRIFGNAKKKFLDYFSYKYRIFYRIMMLTTFSGRNTLRTEILRKTRF